MEDKRVLVLGANGYVGSRLLPRLAGSDWRPVAGVRHLRNRDGGAPELVVDATDAGAVAAALRGVDAVVNCVAGSGETMVANARALVAALRDHPSVHLVHMSSMAVYGAREGDVDESAELDGGLGDYAAAKVEAERLFAQLPSCVMLRPGCIYGPDSPQWSVRIARLLQAHRVGDLGANGDGYCNLVHIDDVSQAIVRSLALRGEAAGAINLSLPEPPTWSRYFIEFGKALGFVPISRIGARRLKLETKAWAIPLKVLELALPRAGIDAARVPPPIPQSLAALWRQEIRLRVDKAESRLALQWTPLERGLRETASAYHAARTA